MNQNCEARKPKWIEIRGIFRRTDRSGRDCTLSPLRLNRRHHLARPDFQVDLGQYVLFGVYNLVDINLDTVEERGR